MLAESAGKICEGCLRSGEIAGLQCLTDCLEILSAIGSRECCTILVGAALAKCGQSVESGLGSSEQDLLQMPVSARTLQNLPSELQGRTSSGVC